MPVAPLKTAELADLAKRWGFVHDHDGKEHRVLRHPGLGKTVTIRKKRSADASEYTVSEFVNILGVERTAFLVGPPLPQPARVNGSAVNGSARVKGISPPVNIPLEMAQPAGNGNDARLPVVGLNGKAPDGSGGGAIHRAPTAARPVDGVADTKPRRRVIELIHGFGGSIKDRDGRLVAQMAEALDVAQAALGQLLRKMETDGQILRDNLNPRTGVVQPRRTYGVQLCYDGPCVRDILRGATEPEPQPPAGTPGDAQEATQAPLRIAQGAPEVDYEKLADVIVERMPAIDYGRLGDAVVAVLVRRLTAPNREHELNRQIANLKDRLGRAVEYSRVLQQQRA